VACDIGTLSPPKEVNGRLERSPKIVVNREATKKVTKRVTFRLRSVTREKSERGRIEAESKNRSGTWEALKSRVFKVGKFKGSKLKVPGDIGTTAQSNAGKKVGTGRLSGSRKS